MKRLLNKCVIWLSMAIIEEAEEFAKNEYKKNNSSHGWKHAEDVRRIALELAKNFDNIDLEALKLAVIFHDIDYSVPKLHTENSIKVAEKFLRENNYPEERIEKVKDIIFSHTTHLRREFGEAKLTEGKILYDADKIIASFEPNKDFSHLLYFDESRELLKKLK